MKKLVDKSNKEKNCIDIVPNRLEISTFNGNLKVKSIKIYEEVLDKFNGFMNENKQLKQQDVVSQALWEFLNKYDK
ncbi:hypothetical protein [Clostridium sp. ZS2-4]|uniref:hypothetical protein n=1 Tax=Clostridium sp. ZS2-4 TaxID=2987703 RepID=UPI00227A09DB|nr:hypothetical protein [Clostridium sp. ZS2-4]MCY6354743.1 hypothetical protein [Clostridium sp. ZS2-4]